MLQHHAVQKMQQVWELSTTVWKNWEPVSPDGTGKGAPAPTMQSMEPLPSRALRQLAGKCTLSPTSPVSPVTTPQKGNIFIGEASKFPSLSGIWRQATDSIQSQVPVSVPRQCELGTYGQKTPFPLQCQSVVSSQEDEPYHSCTPQAPIQSPSRGNAVWVSWLTS